MDCSLKVKLGDLEEVQVQTDFDGKANNLGSNQVLQTSKGTMDVLGTLTTGLGEFLEGS
jgi:hypothetical protein